MNLPCILQRALLAVALVSSASAALAQTTVKVGGLRSITVLPIEYAIQQGYFKREGLDVEFVAVNAGPAVVSAVMSNSVQVGMSASVSVLFARAQNQPIKIFNALTQEEKGPDGQWTWLIASEKSAVKSMHDLSGKTVALNAMGAGCELTLREHLAKSGVPYETVKKIVVPFPQMQAALQLGNADVGCVVEPFRTNIKVNPAIRGVTVGSGILADLSRPYALDVMFVREEWGKAHADVLKRFNSALAVAFADYRKDPTLLRKQMIASFQLQPATVSLMQSNLNLSDTGVTAGLLQPILDALKRTAMLASPPPGSDLILPLQ